MHMILNSFFSKGLKSKISTPKSTCHVYIASYYLSFCSRFVVGYIVAKCCS
ncbi:uncharacterized protein M6B38_350010 [Iris pallida]|uniref:Uncharacterized protein n=1 Tax=Iris pallida TaxID=29817 RepID=A0AAX6GS23_IRIPA|nr:uncharacterized protein M6B38_350010 [Iris pallida]